MAPGNTKLAEVLAGRCTPTEMLAALASQGILVAARVDRSVVLGTTPSGDRVLLGYTSQESYARHGGSYRLTLCDTETILHIWRATGVKAVVVDPAGPAAVSIPLDDLSRFAEGRAGADTAAEAEAQARARVAEAVPADRYNGAGYPSSQPPADRYNGASYASSQPPAQSSYPAPQQPEPMPAQPTNASWPPLPIPSPESLRSGARPPYKHSRHPAVPAIRSALTQVLADFPKVHHVWISDICSGENGEKVMLHVKVHSMIAAEIVEDLHRAVRGVIATEMGNATPRMLARAVDPATELLMLELGCHVVCRRP